MKILSLKSPKLKRLNMMKIKTKLLLIAPLLIGSTTLYAADNVPAQHFDLSHWSMTTPLDQNEDGRADVIDVTEMQQYSHPSFFFLNEQKKMVFTSPNKAVTSPTSSNTRSELRHMLRGDDSKISFNDPANNFVVKAHPEASEFGAIGGKMHATLSVNHVAQNAKNTNKGPAYSVVIGQIHAGKGLNGLGEGNEPLKIYYKKWPNHETGSVFWTYERNLAKADPNRIDIAYPVWGHGWKNGADPKDKGINLDEEFSYTVNVYDNIMYLMFETAKHKTVNYQINLADNVNAYGKVDSKDHAQGYAADPLYFKAGAYNQCSTKDAKGFWYAGCQGTGNWAEDEKNGDFARVSFTHLIVTKAEKPKD